MKMFNIDGIVLLEWIKENLFFSKMIVVIGYDDYYYMCKVIYFGSMDYILKLVDFLILNDMFV